MNKPFIPSSSVKSIRFETDGEECSVIYNQTKEQGEMTIYGPHGYQKYTKDIKANLAQWVQYLEIIDKDKTKKILSFTN